MPRKRRTKGELRSFLLVLVKPNGYIDQKEKTRLDGMLHLGKSQEITIHQLVPFISYD
jgi:hypothetical protein